MESVQIAKCLTIEHNAVVLVISQEIRLWNVKRKSLHVMVTALVTKVVTVLLFVKKILIVPVERNASTEDVERYALQEISVPSDSFVLEAPAYQAVIPIEIAEKTCYVHQNYAYLLAVTVLAAKMQFV